MEFREHASHVPVCFSSALVYTMSGVKADPTNCFLGSLASSWILLMRGTVRRLKGGKKGEARIFLPHLYCWAAPQQ